MDVHIWDPSRTPSKTIQDKYALVPLTPIQPPTRLQIRAILPPLCSLSGPATHVPLALTVFITDSLSRGVSNTLVVTGSKAQGVHGGVRGGGECNDMRGVGVETGMGQ